MEIYIKNENDKYYLDNKKQKALFLVVSWSDAHFSFGACILRARSDAQAKNRARWSKFAQAWKRCS